MNGMIKENSSLLNELILFWTKSFILPWISSNIYSEIGQEQSSGTASTP